jgi:hypothetical protein
MYRLSFSTQTITVSKRNEKICAYRSASSFEVVVLIRMSKIIIVWLFTPSDRLAAKGVVDLGRKVVLVVLCVAFGGFW